MKLLGPAETGPLLQSPAGRVFPQAQTIFAKKSLTAGKGVEIQKTFRGKYPLTVCRLTARGSQALKDYRKTIKAAL